MQRHNSRLASCAAFMSGVLSLLVLAGPAQAQLVNRTRSDDTPAADNASSDDDILAPSTPSTPAAIPSDKAAPRALPVGLVPLVPLGDAGKTTADQVTAELLKQLNDGQLVGASMLDVAVPGVGPAGDGGAKLAAEGAANLARGQALLEKLQFGKAKKAFETALGQLEEGAAALSDPAPLVAAHIGLAEVAARQGQEDAADAALARAAALNPELQLDKKRLPPQFIRSFQRARDALLKATRGTVVVDETGTGSTVEVDGRPMGSAPITLTELPTGRHLVRALREGLPPWGVVVQVRGGETATVSPGFIAVDGASWLDDLKNNRLNPGAAEPVAAAARAKGQRAALVGVLSRTSTSITVQLVLVDAASGGLAKLPSVTFQSDLLDVSIETLKAREAVEGMLGSEAAAPFAKATLSELLEGAKTASSAEMRKVVMRYDVKASREREGSRVVGAGGVAADAADEGGDEDSRSVLAAGKSGKRKRLDDDADPYANRQVEESAADDPDAPITSQPWFLPAVVGGGAAAVVVLGSAAVVSLVALKVVPDPRPADSGTISIALP